MEKYLILFVLTCATALQLPSQFKRCVYTAKDREECLRSAIEEALPLLKDGLPEFNFPKLEPIEVPSMIIRQGTGTVHVVQNYTNVKVYGVTGYKFDNLTLEEKENGHIIFLRGLTNEIRLEADYNNKGRILLLPVYGNGKCTLNLYNVTLTATVVAEHYLKKNMKYSKILEFRTGISPQKAHFYFDNLFDGNRVLGDEINNLLNNQWNEVYNDVKSGYEEAFGFIFKGLANVIYSRVPFDQLFPLK